MSTPSPWVPIIAEELPFRSELLEEVGKGVMGVMENVKCNYVIYGPIGIGKTSILLSLMRRLRRRGIKVIYIPCDRVFMPGDLLNLLREAFVKCLEELQARTGYITPLMRAQNIEEVLEHADKAFEHMDRCCIMLLDDVEELRPLFRYSDVRITPMEFLDLITNSSSISLVCSTLSPRLVRSIYGTAMDSFTMKRVMKLTRDEVFELVNNMAKEMEFSRDALDEIHKVSEGLPLYVHIIVMEILRRYRGIAKETVDSEVVSRAVYMSLREPWGLLHRHFEHYHQILLSKAGHGRVLARILVELAKGPKGIMELSNVIGKPYHYIASYVKRLQNIEVIEDTAQGLALKDRLYREWLNLKFALTVV
ncbi:MAG: hypothetical protein DRN15_04240 [Thermoprotei archaeon]|nr:MAG: hypothetical protein DRM97_05940 [Thermoprotei archaeon]RLF24111.1 MAG: hypothetical protein DRN15_04240 [Thermoprotei archaeon]